MGSGWVEGMVGTGVPAVPKAAPFSLLNGHRGRMVFREGIGRAHQRLEACATSAMGSDYTACLLRSGFAMDIFTLSLLAFAGAFILKTTDQRQRILLLGRHLGQFQIEKLMERLSEGYMRALSEKDPERRQQIWQLQASTEASLASQFQRFAAGLAKDTAAPFRVNRIALPYADRWLPGASFDLREAMRIHARGIQQTVDNTLLAELYLMQHTCHWYCRTRATASARVLARHQTPYAQLVASVSPETRQAYSELVGFKG
jgi:hypothetical protein